jgi:hypothetical protein
VSWEFRRNLWIQLTPHRLLATPLVLGLLFFAGAKAKALTVAPEFLFWMFAGFWGTRRAADSITEEVIGATWPSQRMAAIGAWSMTWGKLFGATAFAWYGAALSWIAYAAALVVDIETADWISLPSPGELVSIIAFALLAQAVSMLVGMIQMRRRPRGRQLALGLAQWAGLSCLIPFFFVTHNFDMVKRSTVWWYGFPFPTQAFLMFSALAFFAWALVAVHQLMRAELQYRDVTWRLPAFALFLLAYVTGLIPPQHLYPMPSPAWLAACGQTMLTLFYVTLLAAPGDPIALMRWGSALRQGHLRLVLELMPGWLPAGVVTAVIGLLAVQQAPALDAWLVRNVGVAFPIGHRVALWVAAVLTFAARDALMVLLFAVGRRPERADVNAIIGLAVLHGILPIALTAIGFAGHAGLTSAVPGATSMLTLAAGIAQIVLLAILLAERLRRLRPTASAVPG